MGLSDEQLKALRENAEALRSFLKSFDEYANEARFWGRHGLEEQVSDLFRLVARVNGSLIGALETIAPAQPSSENQST